MPSRQVFAASPPQACVLGRHTLAIWISFAPLDFF